MSALKTTYTDAPALLALLEAQVLGCCCCCENLVLALWPIVLTSCHDVPVSQCTSASAWAWSFAFRVNAAAADLSVDASVVSYPVVSCAAHVGIETLRRKRSVVVFRCAAVLEVPGDMWAWWDTTCCGDGEFEDKKFYMLAGPDIR